MNEQLPLFDPDPLLDKHAAALAYEATHRADLPTIRIGRRILIPAATLQRLITGQDANRTQEPTKPSPLT